MRKLATATINGGSVDFFEPPHDEPDYLWVDALQLARIKPMVRAA